MQGSVLRDWEGGFALGGRKSRAFLKSGGWNGSGRVEWLRD